MNLTAEQLIQTLSADLQPVRRLRPPTVRAAAWIGAVMLAGLLAAEFADVVAFRYRLAMLPDLRLAVLGAAATAVCAGIAAFQSSVPGRSAAWFLLPVPGAALWLGASGLGCLRDWTAPGVAPATAHDAMRCVLFIVGVSAPLSALLLWMLRQAAPLQPGRVAALGGLAAAAAAASLLALFHPEDASAVDLALHLAAVGLVVVLNKTWSSRLLGAAAT